MMIVMIIMIIAFRDIPTMTKTHHGGDLLNTAYLIFVIFFTLAYFKAWKFYTQKYVNSRQKLSYDKTA